MSVRVGNLVDDQARGLGEGEFPLLHTRAENEGKRVNPFLRGKRPCREQLPSYR